MEGFAAFGIFVAALLGVGFLTVSASVAVISCNDDIDTFCLAWILSSILAATFITLNCMETLFV